MWNTTGSIKTFRGVLVDEETLDATREKGRNPFLWVANNPEVRLQDFLCNVTIKGREEKHVF